MLNIFDRYQRQNRFVCPKAYDFERNAYKRENGFIA